MPAKRFSSEEEMRERLSRISLDEPSVSRRSHCARMDPSTSFRTFDQMESSLVVDEDVDDVEEGGLYVAEEFRHLLTNRLQPKARLDPTLPATQRRTGYEVVLWNPIRPLIIPVDEKPAEDDDTVHLPQSSVNAATSSASRQDCFDWLLFLLVNLLLQLRPAAAAGRQRRVYGNCLLNPLWFAG
ncbi:hypothetical protein D918_00645 [Trichuris suis]|uniref:Uncharacterized protein n=1 Tax=Trichuris suis TaxID=68888 RepID=A0A085MBN8_9BILA|nr:hypothetical protein M513_04579 [Trichuris suis]KHJ49518.1 hypothetical protein D918_00645 [Trichuris suis]